MRIKKISCFNYRNLADTVIEPCDGVNIFLGDNAQGKTNLLEAIWLLTGARSFRGGKDSETVKFGQTQAKLSMDIDSAGREQNVTLKIDTEKRQRSILLNDIPVDSARISEVFSAVVFAPQHLSVIKDGPQERRRFLDTALMQLRPGCVRLINEYARALYQRNTLLKDAALTENLGEMLDLFEDALAKLGSELCYQRTMYTKELERFAGEYFKGLSRGNEELSVKYTGEGYSSKEEGFQRLLDELKESRSNDIHIGCTTVGPHRHDLEIFINEKSAKTFGSQGQQRSAALSLKLSEAAILEGFSGSRPVALLDDVMSELDIHRQEYILNRLYGWQVFITSCDSGPMNALNDGRFFNIRNGEIENVSSSRR